MRDLSAKGRRQGKVANVSEMVERAAKVALAELLPAVSWGECSQGTRDDFLRASRAALSAALDENDEDLVSRVGMEIADEVSGNYSEMTAKRIIAALKAAALGEQ